MLCMLFLSTLQRTESFPSEDHRESCRSGRRGWGWATCLQSLLRAHGLVPGVCVGPQVLLSPHTSAMLGATGANGRGVFPSWAWTCCGCFLASELESSIPGREAIKGVMWRSTRVYLSSICWGLVLFSVLGSLSFRFKSLLLPWDSDHFGSIKVKWKVAVHDWGFQTKRLNGLFVAFTFPKACNILSLRCLILC